MPLLDDASDILSALRNPNAAHENRFPGERPEHQPVHTLYWGAHRFDADTPPILAEQARTAFERHGPDPPTFARILGVTDVEALAPAIHRRVRQRLQTLPIEDLRLDFEDGYGNRSDDEENHHAESTARSVARAIAAKQMPPYFGLRIKPLTNALAPRSIATLDRFVTSLVEAHGDLPDGFVVTLPKVTIPEQMQAMVQLLDRLEGRLGIDAGALRFEIMIEVVQAIFDANGRFNLPRLADAGAPRLHGVHLGVYDYTASAGIAAAWQAPDHSACDLARGLMRLAYGGTGLFLSDGSTNVLPVEPHRGDPAALTDAQLEANRVAVHRAWILAARHIHHALVDGYPQGWDLHPAQLPVRYGATYRFFLESFDASASRLRTFLSAATAATDNADVLDDVATGQALLNFVRRARACGAVEDRDLQRTGLTAAERHEPSFARILEHRRRSR